MIELKNYNTVGSMNLENCYNLASLGEYGVNPLMSLSDFISIWLVVFKQNSIKASSYDRLITSKTALEKYTIASMAIGSITFFDVQRYINELVNDGYSMSAVKKQIQIVTAPLKRAAALRIIPSDPSVGIETPIQENIKKPAKEIIAYDPEEQAKLTGISQKGDNNAYLCDEFMIETGLRVGEALALRWRDVDIPHKRFYVKSTVVNLANKRTSYVQDCPKSHCSKRTLPLTPRAIEILALLKGRSKTEWVFENKKERLSYESLRYQTGKLCQEAGVEYHGEHVFRHTFATNCYYKEVSIKILSKLLGHSDVYITYNTYIHLYGDGFDEMYEAVVK